MVFLYRFNSVIGLYKFVVNIIISPVPEALQGGFGVGGEVPVPFLGARPVVPLRAVVHSLGQPRCLLRGRPSKINQSIKLEKNS
jgi:hypothetical protein